MGHIDSHRKHTFLVLFTIISAVVECILTETKNHGPGSRVHEDHQNEVHSLQRNQKVASQAYRKLQLLRLSYL